MKAWRVHTHGGNEVLKWEEIPTPTPGPMQVLVKVEAVGLNHLDLWVRKGVQGHQFPLPLTLGTDSSGTIAEFGPGAEKALKRLKIGSRVIVQPGLSCGKCEACLGGFDPLCPEFGILGETTDGGCAEFICVPVANILPIPDEMSFEEAAAIGIPFLTAWTMLFRKTMLKPGETILIHAAGSAVSIAAIQMAKMIGATVITTAGSEEKEMRAIAMGADHVIPYKIRPFREDLKKILKDIGKRGCEVVIDHVGSDTFSDSIKSLAWGGRLACCGATSGSDVKLDLKILFFKNLAVHGATMGSKADLIRIVDLIRSRKMRTVVHQILPMSDLPKALDLIEKRKVFGKLILKAG